MSIPMPIQETIRELDARGVAWREIARRVGVSRNTVAKYAVREDYSPQPGVDVPGRSKADEFGAGVCAETIYQAIYVHARCELKRELAASLRRGRKRRKPRKTAKRRTPRFVDEMVPITQRAYRCR